MVFEREADLENKLRRIADILEEVKLHGETIVDVKAIDEIETIVAPFQSKCVA